MLERAKQTGKHFQRLSHVYIFPPAQQKSGITKRKTRQQNYEQYGTQERYSHTTTMSFFVVRRHGVTSRPQDSPKGDTYINLIILVYYEKIIERSYMKVSKLPEPIKPLDDSIVKVTAMGNVFEVSHICYSKSFCSIKKLDSDTYIDLSTGEVKDFNHNESRADDKNSVRTSLSKLRNKVTNGDCPLVVINVLI